MIPRKLILQLLKKTHVRLNIQKAQSISMPVLAQFAREETKDHDSCLLAIARNIEEQKKVPHLTLVDIMNALLAVIRFTFQNRLSHPSSRFEVFADGFLSDSESVILPMTISQSFDEILQDSDLPPHFATLIQALLTHLDTQYATLEWKFNLYISTRNLSGIIGNYNVDKRVFIDITPNESNITGKYRGGSVMASESMATDLSLLFALLEFEKTIEDSRDDARIQIGKIDNKPPKVMLDFAFAKDHHSLALAYLKRDYETHAASFEITNVNALHPGLFHLLDEKFARPVLKTAIYFFHSDKPRLPTFRFLQYWCAIEAMLGSPEQEIGKRLCHAFLLILPEKSEQDFRHLYNTRNDIVHKGVLTVSREDIISIEQVAKKIFYRLFGTVSHLAAI